MTRPDDEFMAEMYALEDAYLESPDPIVQSGFSGGHERWSAERSPLTDAIDRDGDFLDVGCANGLLARDVCRWAAARGHHLVPHGIDVGPRLIALAKERHRANPGNFHTADAWSWEPNRRWSFVYSTTHLAPSDLMCEWLHRMWAWVAPGGRLILGSYGSQSLRMTPDDVEAVLVGCGLQPSGFSRGGAGPIARYAWVDKRDGPGAVREPG